MHDCYEKRNSSRMVCRRLRRWNIPTFEPCYGKTTNKNGITAADETECSRAAREIRSRSVIVADHLNQKKMKTSHDSLFKKKRELLTLLRENSSEGDNYSVPTTFASFYFDR